MSWICSPKLAKDKFSHFQESSKARKLAPSLVIRETSILPTRLIIPSACKIMSYRLTLIQPTLHEHQFFYYRPQKDDF